MSCSICKDKFTPMSKELLDGRICKNCLKKIPDIFIDSEFPLYKISSENINKLLKWKEEKELLYRREFFKTSGYGRLKIDSLHGYLAICNEDDLEDGSFYDDSGTIFDLSRIKNISFDMLVDKTSSERVEVMVTASLSVIGIPVEIINIPIKKDNAAISASNGETVKFSLPYGAQIIHDEIIRLNHLLIENTNFRTNHEFIESLDYAKAMGLYMLDDNYSESDVKYMRKKLLKAFHPDEGEENISYAQKIGDAYELLMANIKSTNK